MTIETPVMPNPAVEFASKPPPLQAKQLANVPRSEHPEICAWLALHPKEHYLVSEDLHTIYTDKVRDRNTLALQRLVQRICEITPTLNFVDAAIFHTLNDMAETTEGTSQLGSTDVARHVEDVLRDAIARQSSDVHVRIRARQTHVLFRIHGLLNHYQTYSRQVGMRLARTVFNYFARTQRDFSEKIPLDGAFDFKHNGEIYGVRVNLMNEVRGCTMVMRIRNQRTTIGLSESGYSQAQYELINRGIQQSGGLTLFCGPTNSGKSTTLSNLLENVKSERNVIAIEDPVELKFDHVAHVDLSQQPEEVQLHDLLACTVRQDPDMLVLAEIRDQRTAQYAENMVLQGRFVASTLHAERVSAIPVRLLRLSMDESNFFVPGFLNMLVAQILLPINCKHCCLSRHPDKSISERYERLFDNTDTLRYRNSDGCAHCHTGVTGRTLVAEVLSVDRQTRTLLRKRDYDGITDYMQERKIMDRHHHAFTKIQAGLLDPELAESRLGMFNAGMRS